MRFLTFVGAPVLAASLIAPLAVSAQDYPSHPVRIIVPYAAGGVVDTTARLVQNGLQERLGQPVVIDNHGGAGGIVGAALGAKAAPDGYTLVMDNESHTVNPAITPKMPFDTERDLVPVIRVTTMARLFVVNVQTPAKTLAEFVSLAKANPGKLNYAGAAAPVQLAMERFKALAGIQVTYVAYRGGAPAMQAMISNETQVTLVPLVPALSYIQAGQLRGLAIVSPKRAPQLPDMPTIVEAGYPTFDAPSWVGLFAPAGTPQPVIARLHRDTAAAVKAPELAKRLADLGMEASAQAGDAFAKDIAREIADWTKVARDNNIVSQE